MNNTFNLTIPRTAHTEYVNTPVHAISLYEIIIILGIFIALVYLYILVHKNKEKYSAWKNPNGRTINLYKQVKLFFWLYVVVVIILGLIQAVYTTMLILRG